MPPASHLSSPPIGEPNPVILGGTSLPARLRRGLLAARPKFFTASILPVVVGTGWGYRQSGDLDATVFLLALLGTVLVHAASNVWNDVGDDNNGADRDNDDRIHPYSGGSRFIQNGVLEQEAMLRLSRGLGAAALLVGAMLVWLKGTTVLWLGLGGLAFGYFYSSPRVRLSDRGVGEAAVGLAFGVLPVCGAAWLQSGGFSRDALLLAVPVSCWVIAILLINEVPDVTADRKSGKATLAVRLGTAGTALLYAGLHSFAVLGVLAMIAFSALPTPVLLAPAMLMTIGWVAAGKIRNNTRGALKQGMEITIGVHAIGCLWLAGWAWLYPV